VVEESKKDFAVVKKGLVKRNKRRVVGLFIDGVALDRAARRINKKIDIASLIQGVTSGLTPIVARYYTLIPYEDDSRHRSYLDAVEKAGLTVVVKRLPPKGITRQVTFDTEMCADIVAFSLGHYRFSSLSTLREVDQEQDEPVKLSNSQGYTHPTLGLNKRIPTLKKENKDDQNEHINIDTPELIVPEDAQRVVTVVCPSHDIKYPLTMAKEFGAETVSADFGKYSKGDMLKSASNWIDLSDSETIWRD
jgi:hypothetical protein